MTLPFSIVQLETFLMVFIRISGLIFTVPIFGSRNVPLTVKAGLSVTIAWIVFPIVEIPMEIISVKLVQLPLAIFSEILIGIVIGFTARLFFEGIQLGGQVIGFQMGFGIVNVLDPVSGANFSVIAQIKNLLATLLFLAFGMHHLFIKAIVLSFKKIPLFHFYLSNSLLQWIFDLSSIIFLVSVKVAAPIMAILIFVSIAMGIIAKGVQGINILIVGFPLKIAAGLFAIGITLPMFAFVIRKTFNLMGDYIFTILKLGYQP